MSERGDARLLLAILAGRLEDAAPPADPARFVALCRRCDVHPTVHARLQAADGGTRVGPEVMRLLAEGRAKVRVDNLLLLARLESALDLLLAAGIRPVALKGVDVLHRFYASFDERTLDDIDLLVPPAARDRAIAVLEEAGWHGPEGDARNHWFGSSYELPLESPGPVPVSLEVHWGLGQEKRYTIDAEAVVARAKPLAVAGRAILRLDGPDAVAHLLLHHVQHYFDRRLKWALDLVAIAREPGFSWKETAARLETWGGRGAAGLALVHLRKLLPGSIAPDAFAALPAASWRLAATAPLRSAHPLDLYRGTRRRWVQLWLAAAALERPSELPGYVVHRARRDKE